MTLGLLLTAYEVIDTLFLEDDEEDETEQSINKNKSRIKRKAMAETD